MKRVALALMTVACLAFGSVGCEGDDETEDKKPDAKVNMIDASPVDAAPPTIDAKAVTVDAKAT
jgi:hypothetical protein